MKKYFGIKGKTIKELYDFKSWRNRRLETEIKGIWRVIEKETFKKKENLKSQSVVVDYKPYDDKRVA